MKPRQHAMQAGLGTYFTGKPCKYGHITYRYTSSGACAQCVSDAAAGDRELLKKARRENRESIVAKRTAMLQPLLEKLEARADALRELIPAELRARDHADMQKLFDTAVSLCLAKYPCLEKRDVYPSSKPSRPGVTVYKVYVPAEYFDFIRQIQDTLWEAHRPNFAQERARIQEAANRMFSDDDNGDEPGMHWK